MAPTTVSDVFLVDDDDGWNETGTAVMINKASVSGWKNYESKRRWIYLLVEWLLLHFLSSFSFLSLPPVVLFSTSFSHGRWTFYVAGSVCFRKKEVQKKKVSSSFFHFFVFSFFRLFGFSKSRKLKLCFLLEMLSIVWCTVNKTWSISWLLCNWNRDLKNLRHSYGRTLRMKSSFAPCLDIHMMEIVKREEGLEV